MENDFINLIRSQKDSMGQQRNQTSNGVKIINATYKLLDFFPDSDPLKNKAKEKTLAVLEGLTLISGAEDWVSLKTCLSADRGKVATQLLDDIEILESYLKLGKYQGWIDNINFLIIIKEYEKIKGEISHLKGNINKNLEALSNIKLEAENKAVAKKLLSVQNSVQSRDLIKDNDYSERKNPPSYKILARQEKILKILTNREKAQVADIIKEIPNVTKRTLRRDLDDLLKKNTIIRVGEWNQVFYQILKDSLQNQQNNDKLDRTNTLSQQNHIKT